MFKNKIKLMSKNILIYHSYICSKYSSRKYFLNNHDVNKLFRFYPFVKSTQCPSDLRELFFNAFLTILTVRHSPRLQNRVSKTLPFLLNSLRATVKLSRVQSTIWKIIHELIFENKSNMIIFRQNNGSSLIKKYLKMEKNNQKKSSREILKCVKSVKRQISKINDCISTAAISEARINLIKEEKLLSNKIVVQSLTINKKMATALEKNVLTIFHKTFLTKLPKIFWNK